MSGGPSYGDSVLESHAEKALEPANEHFAEALAHFSQGLMYEFREDPGAALEQFLLAIEKDPENETLYLLTSRRMMELGEAERALTLMRRLLEREPENVTALLWTSKLYLLDEQEEASLELLMRLLELAPGMEAPYLEAARLYLRQEDADGALEVTRRGTERAEENRRIRQFHAELLLREAARADEPLVVDSLRDEALSVLNEGRERYPDHAPFTFLQAALVGQSSAAAMLPLYRELDEATGRSLEVRNTILVHFVQSLGENASQAIFVLNAYLREHPEDPFGHFMKGLLSELARRQDLAIDAYSKVVELDPDEVDAFRKLALFLFQGAEPNRALQVLETALEHHPEHVDLLSLAGAFALSAEKFEAAAQALDRLNRLRIRGGEVEDLTQFFTLRAMALLAVDRAAEAVEPMFRAIESEAELLEEIWRHQIRLVFRAEDDEALKDRRERVLIDALERLANRRPEDPMIMRLLGRTNLFRRDFDAALEAFEETRRLAEATEDPARWIHEDFLFDFASTLERLGRDDEAMAVFSEVIELDPDHAMALNYLAYMWAERAINLEQGLRYVQRALRLEPQNGAYIDTRGWIFYQMGRYEEAYIDLKRASELEPDESVIAEHMGDVLMKLERPVEAAGYYRIALALDAEEREEIVRESLERAEAAVADMISAEREEARRIAEATAAMADAAEEPAEEDAGDEEGDEEAEPETDGESDEDEEAAEDRDNGSSEIKDVD
ncbi:MAG: tetratricopeptide repeat protein [Verrucomicrobia bacterium]|nr:tetratricopeptide repeat protein [Verrucomicrobiota bacterium]MCH8526592.1 tetratricopeptide repeat protein [Kiritimatiellia bacterium]